jgi:hypothetical protein
MSASIAFAFEAEPPTTDEDEPFVLRINSGLPMVVCPGEGEEPEPLAIAAKVDISGTLPGGGLK